MSDSISKFQSLNTLSSENMPRKALVASSPGNISPKALKNLVSYKYSSQQRGPTGQIALFLLKVAALETVRRFSRARCPFVWKTIQALQVLCYPPFKWIRRWTPFGMVVEGVQKISRPLLVLSIATAFSEYSANCKSQVHCVDDPQPNSDLPGRSSASDARHQHNKNDIMAISQVFAFASERNDALNSSSDFIKEDSRNWMLDLVAELEKKGITLPDRINEDELQRFYDAANGDLSCLLPSLKKTIRWRETYSILSLQDLEKWSHLVFWHGFDVMLRPCLVIRLGLACSRLVPHERPRFAQAVVSQLEHGILHLINEEDPRVTVLMDCEGISPFKFPMQMMRSCSSLVQDHYPNRLGCLFVLRLPPVVRVLAQTIIQVLKPITRQKLRIEGESYRKVLSEFLGNVPAFLGGNCTCSNCENLVADWPSSRMAETRVRPGGNVSEDESAGDDYPTHELAFGGNCDHVLRAAIVAFLMLCVLVAFLAGMYDPEPPLASPPP
ncbi:CRAL/TRIO domain [Musa troglodytarum]|uniref:CRAL/TRIO domain n=2 Tax=Musa troglodytarum TaxID=320322 RepID=A0A9E7FVC8_9LILI|nr:CRAL/TRIO domain [Musa troglodytarum]URE03041.1 CRAL/TRIO domain [Musa troglodytarum]URE05371.1 CRAL/TRIO domain [Musa troglodytarum]